MGRRIVRKGTADTFDVSEVARILGISETSAYRGVAAGEIPALRIGGRWLIPKIALEALLRCEDGHKAEDESSQTT